jgi:hypothetical protein
LIGDDITEDPRQRPRRWIVDFAFMPLEKAMSYLAALDVVREKVKPMRDVNRDAGFREKWWQFGRPRGEMRDALRPLRRYIAGNRVGKRFLFTWQAPNVCPSDLTIVFAFDDDYAMGLLSSAVHLTWAHSESSTLEDRPRYTPTSCFETFPWPQPDERTRTAIGEIAAELIAERQHICVTEQIGLTELYNRMDDGAYATLAGLHARLDAAVAEAYGWPASVLADPLDIRARLVALHREISSGTRTYDPFSPPAVERDGG